MPVSDNHDKVHFPGFISFLPQLHLIPGTSAAFILQSSIVLLGRIDVGVSEHIGHQIDIAGFPVQAGTVGTAMLVRGDYL